MNAQFLAILILFVIICSGMTCSGAPVQEMSDARQALQTAEAAGARRYSPEQYQKARALLEQAKLQLVAGAYSDARRFALDARDYAIRARTSANYQQQL